MIQTIGLLISVYTIIRLIQSPFVMAQAGEPVPFLVRLLVVSASSAVGVLVLVVLSSMLLDVPTNIHEVTGQESPVFDLMGE